MNVIKKDSCLCDKTSVPTGTKVYGFIYPKFEIIKWNLIEVTSSYWHKGDYIARIYIPTTSKIKELNTRCVYTKLEDVYAAIRHRIMSDNELYLKTLKNAQDNYEKFINSIPDEYRCLINENNT